MKSTKRDIAENYLRSREMKLVSWTNSTKFHEKWKKKEKFEEIFKHTDFRYAHNKILKIGRIKKYRLEIPRETVEKSEDELKKIKKKENKKKNSSPRSSLKLLPTSTMVINRSN